MRAHAALLEELARKVRLDALALDDHGECTVSFDSTIVVSFLADNGGLTAVGFVAELTAFSTHITRRLLNYNLVSRALGGARVAVEPHTGFIIMSRRWPVDVTPAEAFVEDITAFINGIEAVRQDIEPLRQAFRPEAGYLRDAVPDMAQRYSMV